MAAFPLFLAIAPLEAWRYNLHTCTTYEDKISIKSLFFRRLKAYHE